MPQKQLPVSPEKKKKRKKVKGKYRLVTKKFPRLPAKAAALKLRESALLFQSPLISGPVASVYFLVDTFCFVFIVFVGKRSVLPQISLCHSFPLSCIQIVKMEGVQPLDENVRNAPGWRFQTSKLLLVTSVIQGLGLLLCLTYICLHFHVSQVRCTTGHFVSTSSC